MVTPSRPRTLRLGPRYPARLTRLLGVRGQREGGLSRRAQALAGGGEDCGGDGGDDGRRSRLAHPATIAFRSMTFALPCQVYVTVDLTSSTEFSGIRAYTLQWAISRVATDFYPALPRFQRFFRRVFVLVYWTLVGPNVPKFAGAIPPPLLEVTPLSRSRETVDCGRSPAQPVRATPTPQAITAARINEFETTIIFCPLEDKQPAAVGSC